MENGTPNGNDTKGYASAGEIITYLDQFDPIKKNLEIPLDDLFMKGVVPNIINRLAKLDQKR
jgi:hypothetical protein